MQGMKPNSAVNPPHMSVQPPVHGLPPHATAPSFLYNTPHSMPAFTGNQHAQSATVSLMLLL